MPTDSCRFCGNNLKHIFCDLGASPLSNSYLKQDQLLAMEPTFPLRVHVCDNCLLVQLQEFQNPEAIFKDYAYFSSYSESWLEHARNYTKYMIERFGYGSESQIIEIASNDGYLLQYFKEEGIPVLGIEPAENVAAVARAAGIETMTKFFGVKTAGQLSGDGIYADLLLGNNVLAHVPDINDFVAGMKTVLKPDGVITMEFPHLLRLMEGNQFDTIYHEHFSYFSLIAVEKIFSKHGLLLFDVEELQTHGGSLRIFACHANDKSKTAGERVGELREVEKNKGLEDIRTYISFQNKVNEAKRNILDFLIRAKRDGKKIAGYGAPAKGNTLLNFCGIRTDFIDFTVDRNPNKQGHFLPGTRIPVYPPEKIDEARPDYLVILPWNIMHEVMEQMGRVREWGCKFVILIPKVEVIE